ncbi:hypothetical protein FD755_018001 [Muntiacus reevesi]|uniref:Myosin motor domain-containing protein n=1 Tax=Muntiacus reevesi TaxID=9886 RepID=A0A5N3XA48_MUNRE|nr:hypothetical protein FD755_018001 [Muntiacus reevesi]
MENWKQIREEDKSPPPSSPPPLFSVIPGGFIRQLVRETEKESKEARLRKEAALASPEREIPEVSAGQPSTGTKPGSQNVQSGSPQSTDVLGSRGEEAGTMDPVLMTINGEKPQESGPSGTPAKKSLPFKRGVRRGDVLLMVAKLDPDSAKPEQRTQPRDAPASKTPPPATDPGGGKKGDTPGTPRGPQASTTDAPPKAEKTQTGGLGDPGTVLLTKGEKDQGTVRKGGEAPQTKGVTKGELQGKEGSGDGGQPGAAEKGAGDPPNKGAKGSLSKDAAGEGKWAGAQAPVRRWGGSLGRRGKWDSPQRKKDKEGALLSKSDKTEEPQTKAEKTDKVLGKVGEAPRAMDKAGEPQSRTGKAGEPPGKMEKMGAPQSASAEAGKAGGKAEKDNKAPKEVDARGDTPTTAGKEDQPERRGQKAEEPRPRAGDGAGALEMEPGGPGQPALEGHVEKPQRPAESQEGRRGGQSGVSGQAPEDRWYEAEKVWLVQKDGFTLATVLKPDEGTADLPAGRVRLCIDADGSVTEVGEEHVHRANPPELDQAEDLASLLSVNESSVLNTLLHRYRAQLPHTRAGPDLIFLQPQGLAAPSAGKARGFKMTPVHRRDGLPAHISSLAQRAYWALLSQQRDQSIVTLGRSGAGKTTCCEQVLEHLVGMAGSVDGRVSVEKIRAAFTVLRAFGSVSTGHSRSATRFAMVMSLDFNATGRVTAAQLQTMLLEKSRVARQPEGEGNFEVFSQMLAGLDLDLRTDLYLHQMADNSSFGMGLWPKVRRRPFWDEWSLGRKQFMRFEWANHAAEALGCEYEELNTATFKHHLRQIIEQVTSGPSRRSLEDEAASSGLKMTGVECVEGMASGLYQEVFAAVVSLINRSFSSHHLSMASIMVVDSPGFQNPRHQGKDRAATFEELCHNYVHERLQLLFYQRTFVSALERFREEDVPVQFDLPESSPGSTVAVVDQTPSQVRLPAGGGAEDARGLFWILDEEVRVEGSQDSVVLGRLCAAAEKRGAGAGGTSALRTCEQPLQCEIAHQLGHDPVRYDLTGWLHKAKPNLAALDAPQVLQRSSREELRNLFQSRAKLSPVCRAVAGLEGTSQQAQQRNCAVRRTFASSLAAVKRKAPCSQIKLQMDALISVIRRSQLHFIHCLVPSAAGESRGGQGSPTPPQPGGDKPEAGWSLPSDIPALRVQLAGSYILEVLRLHRAGYADHMGLTQFRRRFQVLDPVLMKELTSAPEGVDERKAVAQLLQTLDLEKKAVAVGHSQVFLKAGVVSRLEKQREKLVSQSIVLFQAACRGFLSRQGFKKLKTHRLAARCIQKNVAVFLAVRDWPWWRLLASLRPLLSATIGEEQLRAKEAELTALRQKLEKSEKSRNELRQNADVLESKIAELTTELADECFKGDVACQVLESERAERLRASREVQELKSKYEQVQKNLGEVEKRLEEAQQKIQLNDLERSHTGGADEWQMRFDCAQMENEFLRKRLQQSEERLESELASRNELEQKLRELQRAYEEAQRTAQQLKRRCHLLTCDLEDTRFLLESQQSRNHDLERKQKKFDAQLAQALGECVFEKGLREKVAQENTSTRCELGRLQQLLKQKEQESLQLKQEVEMLQAQKQELLRSPSLGENCIASLKERLWKLESSALEHEKVQNQQENTIRQLEQVRQRFELEIERMKQMHQKDREDKEEELEDVRQSCQKRLRQLEMQLEQEYEEKQMVLHEKQDLEGLIGTLCDQIGHRDFDVEKRLRRDLRRTHALLSDVQLLLGTMEDGKTSVSKEELEKVQSQVDEQLYRLQFERADLLKRIDEDQDDLNDLMQKHKDLIAQSAADIGQIQELQLQLEEAKKEKNKLQEQMRIEYLEQSTVDRAIVSRQEAVICDLENKTEFQKVQIKRFEEKYVEELAAIRQTLQTDLETSIRRIADLQAALEEVASSDSDTESVQTAVNCGGGSGRKEMTHQEAGDGARDVRSRTSGDKAMSPLSRRRGMYGHFGDGEECGVQRKAPERPGAPPSPSSQSGDASPLPRDKLPSPSAALSEFVEGLRRQRAQRGRGSPLGLEDWPTLPIYQTTGASTLRRARAGSDEGALALRAGAGSPLDVSAGLPRSTSLKCISSQSVGSPSPPPEKLKTRFSSCESLLESGPSSWRTPSSPGAARRDLLSSPTLRPRRRCLESSVDDAGCPDLGKEPLVFQNRQFAHLMGDPLGSDPFSWKVPSLNYERKTKVDFDDFLPAIRKPETPTSLARAAKDGRDSSQHSSVRFATEEPARGFVSGIGTVLKRSPESREDPAHLSDSSSSSSSIVSFKSADSIKSRPRAPRLEGDGGERASPENREPGAGRKEEDVESIMKKYLQK